MEHIVFGCGYSNILNNMHGTLVFHTMNTYTWVTRLDPFKYFKLGLLTYLQIARIGKIDVLQVIVIGFCLWPLWSPNDKRLEQRL